MKLFLAHCGYLDERTSFDTFESHTSIFIAAESKDAAIRKISHHALYVEKDMHLDGLQEIHAVDGFQVILREDSSLRGASNIGTTKHPWKLIKK